MHELLYERTRAFFTQHFMHEAPKLNATRDGHSELKIFVILGLTIQPELYTNCRPANTNPSRSTLWPLYVYKLQGSTIMGLVWADKRDKMEESHRRDGPRTIASILVPFFRSNPKPRETRVSRYHMISFAGSEIRRV